MSVFRILGLLYHSDAAGIYRRSSGSHGFTRDQTIAIVGVFASVFGPIGVYFLFSYVRECWQAHVARRKAAEEGDPEMGDIYPENNESIPITSHDSNTVVNKVQNVHHDRYRQLPSPLDPTSSPVRTQRVQELGSPVFPERILTWPIR